MGILWGDKFLVFEGALVQFEYFYCKLWQNFNIGIFWWKFSSLTQMVEK